MNAVVNCSFIQQIFIERPLSARHWGCPGPSSNLRIYTRSPRGAAHSGSDPALLAHPQLPWVCPAPPALPSRRPPGSNLEGLTRGRKAGGGGRRQTLKGKKPEPSRPWETAPGKHARRTQESAAPRGGRERPAPAGRGGEAAPAGGGRGPRQGLGPRRREGRATAGLPGPAGDRGPGRSRSKSARAARRGDGSRGRRSLPEHGGGARAVQERGTAAAGDAGAVAAAAAAAGRRRRHGQLDPDQEAEVRGW